MLTRDEHFDRIQPGAWQRVGLGVEWEIDAETWDYFLNVLPPIYGDNGEIVWGTFFMCEFSAMNVTMRYRRSAGRYYAAMVDATKDPLYPSKHYSTVDGQLLG